MSEQIAHRLCIRIAYADKEAVDTGKIGICLLMDIQRFVCVAEGYYILSLGDRLAVKVLLRRYIAVIDRQNGGQARFKYLVGDRELGQRVAG